MCASTRVLLQISDFEFCPPQILYFKQLEHSFDTPALEVIYNIQAVPVILCALGKQSKGIEFERTLHLLTFAVFLYINIILQEGNTVLKLACSEELFSSCLPTIVLLR